MNDYKMPEELFQLTRKFAESCNSLTLILGAVWVGATTQQVLIIVAAGIFAYVVSYFAFGVTIGVIDQFKNKK